MAKVSGGNIVEFGGPLTTDPSASTPIKPFSGTQPAPPAGGVPGQ
jgi:hypothetical protein